MDTVRHNWILDPGIGQPAPANATIDPACTREVSSKTPTRSNQIRSSKNTTDADRIFTQQFAISAGLAVIPIWQSCFAVVDIFVFPTTDQCPIVLQES
jgi:hypothetical protein